MIASVTTTGAMGRSTVPVTLPSPPTSLTRYPTESATATLPSDSTPTWRPGTNARGGLIRMLMLAPPELVVTEAAGSSSLSSGSSQAV